MAGVSKTVGQAIARIETQGCTRQSPPYGGSVDHLPASFWQWFEDSLASPAVEDTLDATEWSLVQAARHFGYHSCYEIASSADWSSYIAPLDSDEANATDVIHAAFAALSGLGLDDCELVDLLPAEQLVLRVYDYSGLLAGDPGGNGRSAALIARGLCVAVMDLAYGGPYGQTVCLSLGSFTCRQSRSVEHGDPFDEFIASRRSSP